MKKVSILIPFYNEQEVLPSLFERLQSLIDSNDNYQWEVMLINDGSTDNSLCLVKQMRLRDKRFRYIDLSRNFGKETAMLAGFDNVTGDCMVIMDADLQHPPEVIPQMLKLWEEGYDDIYGKRNNRGKEPWLRRKLSLLYYKLLQKTTNVSILQNVGDFRLLDRICIDALCSMRESQRYTKGMFQWIGFKKKEFTFDQDDRVAGNTKWSYIKLLNLAIEGITSYTTSPLKIATVMGLIVSLCAFIYMLFVLIKAMAVGDPVAGYPTIMVVMLFLGGVQLLSLGIIGEYVGRIFNETKNRPAYFIREIDGKKRQKVYKDEN
ncbi:MAG: glycosyltransferase family 2 protein [Muribaculaceae bacterium]|nr:glycosyltransferase family 2 protein [Muribaculaceae bacterium]